jgi:putative endonuclease
MFVPGNRTTSSDRRLALGRRGEEIATDHLKALGFLPIARNHRTRHGEIDLVAFDGTTLAFVEVKTRRIRARPVPRAGVAGAAPAIRGYDEQTLGWPAGRQRRRLRRLALAWLHDCGRSRPHARNIRFDVVRILLGEHEQPVEIDHVQAVS